MGPRVHFSRVHGKQEKASKSNVVEIYVAHEKETLDNIDLVDVEEPCVTQEQMTTALTEEEEQGGLEGGNEEMDIHLNGKRILFGDFNEDNNDDEVWDPEDEG